MPATPDPQRPPTPPIPISASTQPSRDPDADNRSARELLAALSAGDPDEILPLRDLLAGLGKRTYGTMLALLTLPALLPIPGLAGGIAGPLTMMVGLQLLIGLRTPWLPGAIAHRGPKRGTLQRFAVAADRWLIRLERLVRPRLGILFNRWPASAFTGVLLMLTGLLLALPIPLTNYAFAGLLLAFALALFERDGVLLLICWLLTSACVAGFGLLGGTTIPSLIEWITGFF